LYIYIFIYIIFYLTKGDDSDGSGGNRDGGGGGGGGDNGGGGGGGGGCDDSGGAGPFLRLPAPRRTLSAYEYPPASRVSPCLRVLPTPRAPHELELALLYY